MRHRLAISLVSLLLPASIALGQQSYVGQYDVYAGYMYLHSSLINLGETGYHTQIGTNPAKWYSVGYDYQLRQRRYRPGPDHDEGLPATGDKRATGAVNRGWNDPRQLPVEGAGAFEIGNLCHGSAAQFPALPGSDHLCPAGPRRTYMSPPYRIPAIQSAPCSPRSWRPAGTQTDWTYFYGFGGGVDFNVTKNFALRVQADFVRDQLVQRSFELRAIPCVYRSAPLSTLGRTSLRGELVLLA